MPDKKGSMEKAYEDAMAGKDAAKAEAKAKASSGKNTSPGKPAAKKPSPAKGMPY